MDGDLREFHRAVRVQEAAGFVRRLEERLWASWETGQRRRKQGLGWMAGIGIDSKALTPIVSHVRLSRRGRLAIYGSE